MTVGFQIFLADGVTVQADDNYRNYALNEKDNATTNQLTNAGGNSFVSFFRTGLTLPILAVGGTGPAVGQVWYDAANARFGFLITAAGGIGTQVPYYIFDVPTSVNPNFGLQIFNAAGQKTFDLMQKYLRVIDMYTSGVSSPVNKTYDASRLYAMVHMIPGFRISNIAGSTQLLSTRVQSGVVTSGAITVDGSQSIPNINETVATLLTVDVTNY